MADLPQAFGKLRHPQKRGFVRASVKWRRVTKAAELAGIYPDSHYYWLKNDESYAQAFKQAR